MKRLLKQWFLALVMVFGISASAEEPQEAEAQAFVKANVDAVLAVLRNAEMSAGEQREKVLAMLGPVFDFALMAKLSLGRQHWPAFSGPQRQEFTELFAKQLQQTYYDKLQMHADKDIQYDSAKTDGKRAQVNTRVTDQGEDFIIIYKLHCADAGWAVYDVEIEGVSVIASYRSQFNDFLGTKPVGELLAEMRAKADE